MTGIPSESPTAATACRDTLSTAATLLLTLLGRGVGGGHISDRDTLDLLSPSSSAHPNPPEGVNHRVVT